MASYFADSWLTHVRQKIRENVVEVSHCQVCPGSESEYWCILVIHAGIFLFFLQIFQSCNWAKIMSGERKQVDVLFFFARLWLLKTYEDGGRGGRLYIVPSEVGYRGVAVFAGC
jgi:hypothetical protein